VAEDIGVDFYEVLQISVNAEPETIHRVYRIFAQRYHPDNMETGSESRFRQISEAYRVLSDPEERGNQEQTGSFHVRSPESPDRTHFIFIPEWSGIFFIMCPPSPGACAPTPWTSRETATLPAFSNCSVTGTLSPCLNGPLRSNIIR